MSADRGVEGYIEVNNSMFYKVLGIVVALCTPGIASRDLPKIGAQIGNLIRELAEQDALFAEYDREHDQPSDLRHPQATPDELLFW